MRNIRTKSSLNNFLWSLYFYNQKKKNCGQWIVTWFDSPLTTVLLLKNKLRTMNSSRIKIQGCVDTTSQLLFNNLSYWPQYSVLLLKKNWQWEPFGSAFSPIYMAKFLSRKRSTEGQKPQNKKRVPCPSIKQLCSAPVRWNDEMKQTKNIYNIS